MGGVSVCEWLWFGVDVCVVVQEAEAGRTHPATRGATVAALDAPEVRSWCHPRALVERPEPAPIPAE